jgi:gas vesicle protein
MHCDNCDFDTVSSDSLRLHIVKDHTVNLFQGLENNTPNTPAIEINLTDEQPRIEISSEEVPNEIIPESHNFCFDANFPNKDDIEKHLELHSHADNMSLAFHVCRVCNKVVSKKDPNIQCSKCIYFFQKRCTGKKDARGNWKSSLWTCHICCPPSNPSLSIQRLNPNAESFPDPAPKQSILESRTKLPPLTGRQRKSNINLENPETDFLKSQVDTLKSIVSQNDEEIKKLKQSNELKAKRINQLESKVQEAQNVIAQQARLISNTHADSNTNVS